MSHNRSLMSIIKNADTLERLGEITRVHVGITPLIAFEECKLICADDAELDLMMFKLDFLAHYTDKANKIFYIELNKMLRKNRVGIAPTIDDLHDVTAEQNDAYTKLGEAQIKNFEYYKTRINMLRNIKVNIENVIVAFQFKARQQDELMGKKAREEDHHKAKLVNDALVSMCGLVKQVNHELNSLRFITDKESTFQLELTPNPHIRVFKALNHGKNAFFQDPILKQVADIKKNMIDKPLQQDRELLNTVKAFFHDIFQKLPFAKSIFSTFGTLKKAQAQMGQAIRQSETAIKSKIH